MIARQPTPVEILTPHKRKRIASAIDDDALAPLVFDMLGMVGTFTPDEWHTIVDAVQLDRRTIGQLLAEATA